MNPGCFKCKHSRPRLFWDKCFHPNNMSKVYDHMTGWSKTLPGTCDYFNEGGKCELFEIKKTLWQRIVGK